MRKLLIIFAVFVVTLSFQMTQLALAYKSEDRSSTALVSSAWQALEKDDLKSVLFYTNTCIQLYGKRATIMQNKLEDYPSATHGAIHAYWALNDVATAYHIQGEAYRKAGRLEEARKAYQTVIDKFSYGQCWDPKGWFWKPAEVAVDMIVMIDHGLDLDFGDYRSVTLIVKAWEALEEDKLEEALVYTNKLIKLYSKEALRMQSELDGYPEGNEEEIHAYWALNDVATAYHIQGEVYRKGGKYAEARNAYQTIIDKFSYGQCWDPRGWFWKPSEVAASWLDAMAKKD
jgi:tetratricopeptide (TPR) repeat protein